MPWSMQAAARVDRWLRPEGQGPSAESNHQDRPEVHRDLRPLANEDPVE